MYKETDKANSINARAKMKYKHFYSIYLSRLLLISTYINRLTFLYIFVYIKFNNLIECVDENIYLNNLI